MQALNLHFSTLRKLAVRYFLVWTADAVSIGVTALLLPGIYFQKDSRLWFLDAFVVAFYFAILNVLVRPLLIILILPINYLTLGLITLVLNASLFYLMNALVAPFVIESFTAALIGTLVLTTVNTLLGNVIQLGDDYSFFSALMDRVSARSRPKFHDARDRGLVIVQIDGLSFKTLKKAINRGRMPFINDMLSRRRYVLKKWFCGLPSQTSAVQAGIFYGSSYDIPGFRWYDKAAEREIVSSSSSDMREIDARFQDADNRLLKEGTCINGLIHGGAKRKLITLSVMFEKDFRKRTAELEDFAIYSLHPYLYNRAILLLLLDFLIDRFQSLLDIVKRKKPRVKRSILFSFLRGVGNAFLRESTTHFLIEDLVRGAPVAYVNYIGYDIVAHHAGTDSLDAINTLSGIDRNIKKIYRTIIKRAPRRYDLIVLSDHGQSNSVPFSKLYGQTLAGFIEEKLKTPSSQSLGDTEEGSYFSTLLGEMELVETAYAPPPIIRSRRTMERIHSRASEEPLGKVDQGAIRVCCSGNLAHVYFTDMPGRVTTEQIMRDYPVLLDVLVSHPGIGFIATTNEEGEHLVIGKHGIRRLRSGQLEGEDPLSPYGDVDFIEREIRKLCEYPSSGDVIINGSYLGDGAVICFEEQVGSHGGAGGSQTEPFVMFPERFGELGNEINNPEDMHRFLTGIIGDSQQSHPTTERSETQ